MAGLIETADIVARGPAPLMAGFELLDVDVGGGITLRIAKAGNGPPLLLLHGHPQTHVTWRKIAPDLARTHTVIAADLRGYGDSSKPDGGEKHIAYSKREMAKDQVALMRRLGFDRFALVAHDRGARVAHRMALDFPQAVARLALFDIAPTATMYARTDKAFATRYFWWFFLIQRFPLPERMIGNDPEFFLNEHIFGQIKISGSTEPAAFAEYLRCYTPATIHAICEDYRAAATIDLDHDAADAEKRVAAPLLALWGGLGTVGALYDVLETWREKADDVRGRALPCGHTPQEECPHETLDELRAFLA
ncbi:alpha/beta fold hydrolase [Roseixanthobacter liquoris]|uniref:alpha/beta fold hydrolase n=1 Tax=Roseixanthobacter liquoris TaxID=3119921 RepID=UPI003727D9BE